MKRTVTGVILGIIGLIFLAISVFGAGGMLQLVIGVVLFTAAIKLLRLDKFFAKKPQAKAQEASRQQLRHVMYDWVTKGDREVRPSHAMMNWVRCRWDDPTVCSYDNGETWQPRREGATHSHPGEEEGCRCEAHPYLIEQKIEIKIKR
jgi:hypothetical protein